MNQQPEHEVQFDANFALLAVYTVTDKLFSASPLRNTGTFDPPGSLVKFLEETLPEEVPATREGTEMQTRQEFIDDVCAGLDMSTMSIRVQFVAPDPSAWILPTAGMRAHSS